jgi:hypothetical protein
VVLVAQPQGFDGLGQRLSQAADDRRGLRATDLLADLVGAMSPTIAAAEPIHTAWRDGSVRCVFDAHGDAGRVAQRAAGLAVGMQDLARAFGRRLRRRLGQDDDEGRDRPWVTWHIGLAGGSIGLGSGGQRVALAVGRPLEAAQRLTACARRLGLGVLVDEWTRAQAGSMYLARPIGLARLHDAHEPTMVWQLLGEASRISAVQRQQVDIAGQMVRLFTRREFDAAMQRVEALAALDARDPLAAIYRKLISQRRSMAAADFDATLPL